MENNQNSETTGSKNEKRTHTGTSKGRDNGVSSGFYGLGFIGAAIYFISHASTFWIGVLGFLKAIVWPAILVYNLLEFLKM